MRSSLSFCCGSLCVHWYQLFEQGLELVHQLVNLRHNVLDLRLCVRGHIIVCQVVLDVQRESLGDLIVSCNRDDSLQGTGHRHIQNENLLQLGVEVSQIKRLLVVVPSCGKQFRWVVRVQQVSLQVVGITVDA